MSNTTTITPEERANLRRLAGAATPRPWKMRKHCDESAHMEVADSVGIVCTTPFYGFEYPEQWTNGEYIAAACNAATRLLTALEAAEAESARLLERLEAALNKIAEIKDEWESEGVCHACGICAGIPYEWQRPDGFCCRVALGLWIEGKPLPWEEAARRAVAAGEGE